MTNELHETFYDDELPLPARLDAGREILRQLNASIKAVRESIADQVRAEELDDDLLATLYWVYEDIVPTTLLGHYHHIREAIEPRCPWTYPCPRCGKDQPVTSRTALRALQALANQPTQRWNPSSYLCPDCLAARNTQRDEAERTYYEARRRRVRELRTMPYREYLRTPEWQERRKARLKAARFRCQVCNTKNGRLNVHHRTYERRGEELAADLIVLCEPCHHMFHRNGSLAPHGEGD